MRTLPLIAVLIFQALSFGYEVSLPDEESISSSCKISMQITMASPEVDGPAGRAVVEVKLINDLGNPLSGYTVQLTSTRGTFVCQLPEQEKNNTDDQELDRSCFLTGHDGKIKVNLINVPQSEVVQVKAVCDCGGYQVFTSGNLNFGKKIIKRKK